MPTTGIPANRFQAANAVISIAANFTSMREHFASSEGDITDLQFTESKWYLAATGIPTVGGNRTIKKFIEYPAGVFHQVRWAGSTTLAITSGSYKSDVVLSSVTGLPLVIPASAKWWERTVNLGATVSNFPVIQLPASSVALGVDDGNDATDKGDNGTIAPTSTVNTFGANGMIGTILAENARSFVLGGDSIFWGEGDISGVGPLGGSGWGARAMDALGLPYIKIARGGQSAQQMASAMGSVTALFNLLAFSDMAFEWGVNDLRLGQTDEQILANQQLMYTEWGAGRRLWQTTITPRSDSTDGYATVAGQTPKTDGRMVDLTPLNTAIRLKPSPLFGIIEAADAAMSARDSNVWRAPPVPVTDGTHPNSYMADYMADALYSQFALPVAPVAGKDLSFVGFAGWIE
ncbi:SGNH hydrolase-type protein [Rhizobium phage RHph_X2_26]|nr:SGNH hydrolase-type protein [Rhizobium phage RHph_X2_26]